MRRGLDGAEATSVALRTLLVPERAILVDAEVVVLPRTLRTRQIRLVDLRRVRTPGLGGCIFDNLERLVLAVVPNAEPPARDRRAAQGRPAQGPARASAMERLLPRTAGPAAAPQGVAS